MVKPAIQTSLLLLSLALAGAWTLSGRTADGGASAASGAVAAAADPLSDWRFAGYEIYNRYPVVGGRSPEILIEPVARQVVGIETSPGEASLN